VVASTELECWGRFSDAAGSRKVAELGLASERMDCPVRRSPLK
jgi:hypothetical protein